VIPSRSRKFIGAAAGTRPRSAQAASGAEAITASTARWRPSPQPPLAQAAWRARGDEFSRPGRY